MGDAELWRQGMDEELARQQAEAVALCGGVGEERLAWRSDPGAWSAADCLEHLAVSNELYLPRLAAAVERARRGGLAGAGPPRLGAVERWFVRTLEPPPRRRLPAPRVFRPQHARAATEALPWFDGVQAALRERLAATAGVDLTRARLASPVTPLLRLSVGGAYEIIAAHNRRHLLQATRALQRAASA